MDIPRGKFVGECVNRGVVKESDHFLKCQACGGWIDCRDLGSVFDHEGPLPHPVCDQPRS
jgi:CRISPR/Cas system type I-B associated protein Csh2 (Cas7 group RAMP superfamily)